MSRSIAIVEDDPHQRKQYALALRERGYQVEEYEDRDTAIQAFEQRLPDLIILDIMLKENVGGGFDICRHLKSIDSTVPVIFMTSRGDELDKIYGLQLGAWDYQTKPVSLDFLLTRIESLFRIQQIHQYGLPQNHNTRTYGDLVLNLSATSAQWQGQHVILTPTEFDIVRTLTENREGVSIEGLSKATRQGVVEDNTINTHILHIRKKFKAIDSDFAAIKTRYGFGYCWVLHD